MNGLQNRAHGFTRNFSFHHVTLEGLCSEKKQAKRSEYWIYIHQVARGPKINKQMIASLKSLD